MLPHKKKSVPNRPRPSTRKRHAYRPAQCPHPEPETSLDSLAAREARLRLIVDSLPVLIAYHDRNERFLFCNKAHEAWFGRPRERIQGRRLEEVLGPAYPAIKPYVRRVLKGEPVEFEARLVHPNWGVRETFARGVPSRRPDGKVHGYFAVVEDITERKAIEQALRESEERYRRVVEDQTEFIVRWRPDGTRTFVNESYARYFGAQREELIGTSFLNLVAEEDRERVRRKVASISPTNPAAVDVHRVNLPDGSVGWNEWTDRGIFDAQGHLLEFQSVGRDVTEQKRLQEQLLQAHKMESIGTLAAGIAHDFGNLLGVVLGCASVAKRQPGLSPKLRELLEDIASAAERGAAYTQQLLVYARGGPKTIGRVDVNEVVRSVIRLLAPAAPRGIHFVQRLREKLPQIPADRTQIEQVLLNVCLNAVQASTPPNRVEITTDEQSMTGAAARDLAVGPGPYIRVRVRDQGCGMDEATAQRVFDPFFTTKPMGRGMGLASALGIIRDHRGQIRLETRAGRGTTVSIWLPAERQAPSKAARHRGP